MNDAKRLLAPLLVDFGAHRAPHGFGDRIGIAAARTRQVLDRRDNDIENIVRDDLAFLILFRNTDQINLGIVGEIALLGHGDGHECAARKRQPPPLDDGARLLGFKDVAVLEDPPVRQFFNDGRIARSQPHQIAVLAD